MSEAAARLGVSRQRLTRIIADYPDFPAPVAELSVGRIWASEDVDRWAAVNPRRPGRPRILHCDVCGEDSAGSRIENLRFEESHRQRCGKGEPTTSLAGTVEQFNGA